MTNVTSDEADVAPKGSQKLYAYLATSSQLSNSSAVRSSVLTRCVVSDVPATNPGPAASLSESHLSGVKSVVGDTGYIPDLG